MYYCTVTSIKHTCYQLQRIYVITYTILEMHRIVRRPVIAAVAVGTGTFLVKNNQTLLGTF